MGEFDQIILKCTDQYDDMVLEHKSMKLKTLELDSDLILFSSHSVGMEGSTFTVTDTKVFSEDPFHQKMEYKSYFEMAEMKDHFDAFHWLYKNKKEPITIDFIKEIHKQTMNLTYKYRTAKDIDSLRSTGKEIPKDYLNPGEYRIYSVGTGLSTFMDYEDIEENMQIIFDIYEKQKGNEHPLVTANRIHTQFLKIHPFADGNGRTARLLLNKILWENGLPTLVIFQHYKARYVKSLQESFNENKYTKSLLFLKNSFGKLIEHYKLEKKKLITFNPKNQFKL